MALLASVFTLAVFPISNFDIFWHMSNGREMLLTGSIINEDVFSFTAPGAAFHNHEWLSQMLLFKLHGVFGPDGLIIFKALMSMGIFGLGYLAARAAGAGPLMASALMLLAALAGLHRLTVRPHIFSYLFFAWMLYVLFGTRSGRLHKRFLYAIPPLMVLWDTFHGAVFGLVLLTAFTGGYFCISLVARRIPMKTTVAAMSPGPHGQPKEFGRALLIVGIVTLALMLISPFGLRTYGDILGFAPGQNLMIEMTEEFRPPGLDEFGLFWALMGVSVGLAILLIRRADPLYALVLLPVAVMAMRYNRAIVIFSLTAALALAHYTTVLQSRHQSSPGNEGRIKKAFNVIAALLALGLLVHLADIKFISTSQKYSQYSFGTGVNGLYVPEAVGRYMKEIPVDGRFYNRGNLGGYLAWELYPGKKIFMYNHHIAFSDVFSKAQDRRFIDEYGITHAVVMYDDLREKMIFAPQEWLPVFWDGPVAVLVRDLPETRAFLESNALRYCVPGRDARGVKLLFDSGAPAGRLIRECMNRLAYASDPAMAVLMGRRLPGAAMAYESPQAALVAIKKALGANPASQALLAARAIMMYRAGDISDNVLSELEAALKAEPALVEARLTLGYLLLDKGQPARAVEEFGALLLPGNENPWAFFGRGLALKSLGERAQAGDDFRAFLRQMPSGPWADKAREHLSDIQ